MSDIFNVGGTTILLGTCKEEKIVFPWTKPTQITHAQLPDTVHLESSFVRRLLEI